MSIENYYFRPCNYLLIVSYEGTKHPGIIERGYVHQLDKILNDKNKGHLKGCSSWVIRNTKGKLIKSSKNVKAIEK
tara:strand:+ start:2074 stop:2301 length:228 start_codon:yes stop_codon:yes gene_type:complete